MLLWGAVEGINLKKLIEIFRENNVYWVSQNIRIWNRYSRFEIPEWLHLQVIVYYSWDSIGRLRLTVTINQSCWKHFRAESGGSGQQSVTSHVRKDRTEDDRAGPGRAGPSRGIDRYLRFVARRFGVIDWSVAAVWLDVPSIRTTTHTHAEDRTHVDGNDAVCQRLTSPLTPPSSRSSSGSGVPPFFIPHDVIVVFEHLHLNERPVDQILIQPSIDW